MKSVSTSKTRPKSRLTLRGLGGRHVIMEGFGGHTTPVFLAIAGSSDVPVGAWLSRRELRRLVEAGRKMLK